MMTNLVFRSMYRLDKWFHDHNKTGPVATLVCNTFEEWLWRLRD